MRRVVAVVRFEFLAGVLFSIAILALLFAGAQLEAARITADCATYRATRVLGEVLECGRRDRSSSVLRKSNANH